MTTDLHQRPGFDQNFWFWTQVICGNCIAIVDVVKGSIITAFLLLQLPQNSSYVCTTVHVQSEIKKILGQNRFYGEGLGLLFGSKTKLVATIWFPEDLENTPFYERYVSGELFFFFQKNSHTNWIRSSVEVLGCKFNSSLVFCFFLFSFLGCCCCCWEAVFFCTTSTWTGSGTSTASMT